MVSIRSVRVYLSLGSNIGERERCLHEALAGLKRRGAPITQCSSIYETEPVGFTEQPDFLNLVCEARTSLSPRRLLDTCLALEIEMGRTRKVPKGPRKIDIDILFYGRRVIDEPDLAIPHERLYSRAFVLIPLAEIAPNLRDPRSGHTALELLETSLERPRVVRLGSAQECGVWP